MIRLHEYGVGNYRIARTLSIDPGYVHRKLYRLIMHGVISKINSYPVLYKISFNTNYELKFIVVACPKCNWEYKIHKDQVTKQCENPECFRKNGMPTRFNINNKRIIASK